MRITNYHRPGTTNDNTAVGSACINRRGILAIDENSGGQTRGQCTATRTGITLACS
ncbi:hypothetical protein EMIT0P171_120096 [Pseudomonas sp. IT-P171]